MGATSFEALDKMVSFDEALIAVTELVTLVETGASMTANYANRASGAITVREVLRLLWEADHYPILGNHDAREAAALTRDALDKASTAVSSPDNPPEFADWLAALQRPKLPNDERAVIIEALYRLFDPSYDDDDDCDVIGKKI